MGLEVVLNQIQSAGQKEESNILEQAHFEKDRILAEAQRRADAMRADATARTEARLEALRRELTSAAEFESRRRLLVARRELAEDFRRRVLESLSTLAANKNQALLTKLAQRAKKDLPAGTAHARKADLPTLTAAGFKAGRDLPGPGGFQVESADGLIVLDLRYETLLENVWKQILAEHQNLFEA
jgi:vacuolar-type H+-ATPase subunit E/Vma4